MRHVALLIESSGSYGRGLLQGIARYNREHEGWSTYYRPHGPERPFPDWITHWKGDGMIVRIENKAMAEMVKKTGVPVVNLRGTVKGLSFPFLAVDNEQVATLAATHLQERRPAQLRILRTTGGNQSIARRAPAVFSEDHQRGRLSV